MIWVLVDAAVALLAVSLLAVAGLRLWRRVKALGREVKAAGMVITPATTRLAEAQAQQQSDTA